MIIFLAMTSLERSRSLNATAIHATDRPHHSKQNIGIVSRKSIARFYRIQIHSWNG